MALTGYKNAIPPVDFGTLPIVTAQSGRFKCDKEPLGTYFTATLVSVNDRWAVAPNEDKAPKELCKFSIDGEVLSDGSGTTVEEHIEYLKEEGFKNACAKRYNDLIVILNDAETDHENIGDMVSISLSPQSVKQFEGYQLQSTVKIAKGELTEAQAAEIKCTAKIVTFGSNEFTRVQFRTAE